MKILSVYAHEESSSLTSSLRNTAEQLFLRQGHQVVTTDLYTQGFEAVAHKWDFSTVDPGHYNYMFQQLAASRNGMQFSADISGEMQKIKDADMIIFHFPLWWGGVPAILKGWFDRVFAMGFAWDGEHIFEHGLMRGKRAMVVVTVGEPQQYYQTEGVQKTNVRNVLQPLLHGTLAFCGFDVYEPHIVHDVTKATPEVIMQELAVFQNRIETLFENPQYYHA